MNCVYINKDIIDKKLDAKNKVEEANTFYAFAISFGRIIDLGNVSNTVYCLLQLFEEYKCFFFFKMKEDPIDRLWFPITLQSYQQINKFNDNINGIDGDSSASLDDTHDHYEETASIRSNRKYMKPSDRTSQFKSINQLPFPENSTTDFNTYFESTVQYSIDDWKSGSKRIEPGKIEYFKIFSFQNIGFELDYYEVSHSLMSVLILIYNKMYDNRCLNESMFSYFEMIDKSIMETIIEPLTNQIETLAEQILDEQFTDIKNKLSYDDIVKNHFIEPEFNKLTQKQ